MRSLRTLLPLAVLALLATAAEGGTQVDPEIVDPPGDGDSSYSGAAGDRDLIAVWIEDDLVEVEGGPAFRVHALNSEDIDHWSSLLALHERIRIGFVPSAGLAAGAVEAYVYIRPSLATTSGGNPGSEFVTCRGGFATAAGGSQDINTEPTFTASFADGEFICDVPLSFLPGFDPRTGGTLSGLYATFEVVTRGPVSGNPPTEPNPPRVLETADRAPDEGTGRQWPATLAVTGSGGLNRTLDGPSPQFGGSFPNATTRTDRYAWQNPSADVRLVYTAAVEAGTASILATSATGTVLFNQTISSTGNGTATLTQATGNVTFEVTYEGFQGNLTVQLEPATTGPGTTSPGGGTTEPGGTTGAGGTNTSAGGTTSGTGTQSAPHLGVAAMALVLAFVARRRLR